MKIRSATPGDLEEIVAIKVAAIRPIYEPTGSEALREDYDVGEQRGWLAFVLATMSEESPLLVAVDEQDQVVGWVRLGRDPDGDEQSAEVKGLFVDPSRQGEGIGRRLVSDGCQLLSNQGYRRVKVQTLAGSPACDFYQRCGGRHAGDVPFRGGFMESVFLWDDIELVGAGG